MARAAAADTPVGADTEARAMRGRLAALDTGGGIAKLARQGPDAGATWTDACACAPVAGFETVALYVPVTTFEVFVNVKEPLPSLPAEIE